MHFELSATQKDLAEKAKQFAESTVNAHLDRRDRKGVTDPAEWRALWSACAEYGLLGLAVPQSHGGAGHDVVTTAAILHGFGEGCRDNGLALALSAQIWPIQMPLLEFGTEEQLHYWVPRMLDGRSIVAHAITEARAGSNALAMEMHASQVEDGYVLNGTKVHIGQAPVCDLALVFAQTNPEAGRWGLSAFLVDCNLPGVERGPAQHKMGLRSAPFGTLSFKSCHVPGSARLGPEGAGASIFTKSLDWERRLIFCSHVGSMKRQLDEAVAFARNREVFDQPIIDHQSVGNRLSEMRLRYETSWLMLMRAAWQAERQDTDAGLASLTKLHISEAFLASSMDAVRLFGGIGYLQDTEIERDLRDAMGGVLYGGTSDIQRLIAARYLKTRKRR